MAYTNKTANYELPQYVPTDQPTYLEDFNGAMFTIDSGMKENSTNIGDLSSLTTTAKTDLVSAINEVDYNTDTNTTAIGDLSTLTTTAKTSVVDAINEVVSSSGGSCNLHLVDAKNYSSSNPFIFEDVETGTYIIYKSDNTYNSNFTLYMKSKASTTSQAMTFYDGTILNYFNDVSTASTDNSHYFAESFWCYGIPLSTYKFKMQSNGRLNYDAVSTNLITSNNNSAIGSNYNSSATQYLKNENGTIIWVTESNVAGTCVYMGKINAYNSSANALDLSNYTAGTRVILKHNDSSRSFFLKVGSNTAEVTVTSSNDEAILNNTYYVDVNSISGSTASVSVVWASTYEWCPLVTNTILVSFASGGATVGAVTRNMQGYTLFQLEEDSSGNLNTNVLQYFVTIRTATFSKQYAPQRPAIHYLDKDKNSCLMSFTSLTSGSQQVYDGIMTTKTASTSGLYETYKIRLELNYSNGVYQSHVLTKTKIGDVFDTTAITGYSATGTKTLGLNNGALEWV